MYRSVCRATGQRVTVTMRKISVKAESTSDSAISFGVRCREAPSTRAIMRSRNDLPAAAVTRITMRSESTRVPPVTPERSPPASRTTGADSPVMADSSTLATPARISPSPGISMPASMTIRSPSRSSAEPTSSQSAGPADLKFFKSASAWRSRRACVVPRVFRRLSAWALPRASAKASAKFANTTVRNNQTSSAIR